MRRRSGIGILVISVATACRPPDSAIAPTLDLDFTTGSLDSRITASGAANGTRVNSSGIIVAATTPRFDYDPSTLAALGVRVEEMKTISRRPQPGICQCGVGRVQWPGQGRRFSGSRSDGTMNAYEISFGSTGGGIGSAGAFYQLTPALATTSPYAVTFYAEAKTSTTTARISMSDDSTNFGSNDLSVVTTAYTRMPVMATTGASAASPNIALRNNTAGDSGNCYVWGAQLELASASYSGYTSVIPTNRRGFRHTNRRLPDHDQHELLQAGQPRS